MIRVAIVEDNLEEQKKLFSLLEKYSLNRNCEFCFSCFVSGEDLLKQFVEHMYDLVFLDIVLPGMNGIETASIIREKDRNVIHTMLQCLKYAQSSGRCIQRKQKDRWISRYWGW